MAASQTKETIMIIGKFENQANGRITGELDALLVGCIALTFEPNSKGADCRRTHTPPLTKIWHGLHEQYVCEKCAEAG